MPLTPDPNGLSVLQRLRSLTNVGELPPNAQDETSLSDPALAPTQPDIEDSQRDANARMLRDTGGAYGFYPSRAGEESDLIAKTKQNLALGGIQGRQKLAELTAPNLAKAQGDLAVEGLKANSPLALAQADEARSKAAGATMLQRLMSAAQGGSPTSGGGGLTLAGQPASVSIDANGGVSLHGQAPQHTPQQILSREDNAARVESHINLIEAQAKALQQKGLIGPVMGRVANLVGGKFNQPSMITRTPEDAQLLTDFYQNLSTLGTGMAMVHGGVRGGGSPVLAARFDKGLSNGHTDINGLLGTLASMREWLSMYRRGQAPDEAPGNDQNARDASMVP